MMSRFKTTVAATASVRLKMGGNATDPRATAVSPIMLFLNKSPFILNLPPSPGNNFFTPPRIRCLVPRSGCLVYLQLYMYLYSKVAVAVNAPNYLNYYNN